MRDATDSYIQDGDGNEDSTQAQMEELNVFSDDKSIGSNRRGYTVKLSVSHDAAPGNGNN